MTTKSLFFIAIIALQACNSIPDAGEGKVHLFREGTSNYSIIISKDASETEKTAATELRKYLIAITGKEIPVATDDAKKAGKQEILIGKTNRENSKLSIDREALGSDGYQIFWSGKRLVIAGGGERGTLYGVYTFLESLGCRFFAVGVETVPKKETITLSLSDTIREKPIFEYRDVFWSVVYDADISVKLKINGTHTDQGGVSRAIPPALGGGIRFTKPHFVHTFHYLIPAEEYFESHPEYFSEINGKRTSTYLYSQLCLTNPEVLRLSIEKVKTWLRDDPEGKIVSVSQDDSFIIESYCTCPACAAIDAEEGSHAGALLRFVNAVADAVKDEFPDVAIETLAYQYSVAPPKITKPRDNVIIRLCTGGCNAHPIATCPNNAGAKSNIVNWAKICNRLYIWDYTTNFAHYIAPFPSFNALQPNARFFAENNVKGVFEQGNYQGGENGEFGNLRAYLLAKLLWDPYTNIQKHKQEFLDAYYGSASPYIREYLDGLHAFFTPENNHFYIIFDPAELFNKYVTDEVIAQADALWEQAKKVANNDEVLARVRRAELQYRYYKLLAGRGDYKDEAHKAQFYQDCHDLGVTRLTEGADIPPVMP